jgi:hypothetical protein
MAHAGTIDTGPRIRIPRLKVEVRFEVKRVRGGGNEPNDDKPGFWRWAVRAVRSWLR